jgi:hypothetical protein
MSPRFRIFSVSQTQPSPSWYVAKSGSIILAVCTPPTRISPVPSSRWSRQEWQWVTPASIKRLRHSGGPYGPFLCGRFGRHSSLRSGIRLRTPRSSHSSWKVALLGYCGIVFTRNQTPRGSTPATAIRATNDTGVAPNPRLFTISQEPMATSFLLVSSMYFASSPLKRIGHWSTPLLLFGVLVVPGLARQFRI